MTTIRARALIARGDSWGSSSRKIDEVVEIFERTNEIWRQAEVRFLTEVVEWSFDPEVLEDVIESAQQSLADAPRLAEVTGEEPRQITALYVHSIGGASGKVFRAKRTVVVADATKVAPDRTTAHEIGHIFGLEHWLDSPPPAADDRPPNQLMARSQLGTELTSRDLELVRARLPGCGLDLSG